MSEMRRILETLDSVSENSGNVSKAEMITTECMRAIQQVLEKRGVDSTTSLTTSEQMIEASYRHLLTGLKGPEIGKR